MTKKQCYTMNKLTNFWKLPEYSNKPNFIICGAMKSGTTTLHAILNQHPDVFIPQKEIHYFDMDNIVQHPDFNTFEDGKWHYNDISNMPEKYWHWYSSQFDQANEGQLLGEDSTTYLASPLAAERISLQSVQPKIIIMLRNPTSRAYSQYWHLLRSGRATYSFEDTIKYNPHSVLDRSMYLSQLKHYYQYFPKHQIKIVIFEDFLSEKLKHMTDICSFLEIDIKTLPESVFLVHKNQSRIPKYPYLQLLKNRFFRAGGNNNYNDHFFHNTTSKKPITFIRLIEYMHRKINPLIAVKAPKIELSTKLFLDDYFKRELAGINELLEKDVLSLWFNDD